MPKTHLTDLTLKHLLVPERGQTTYWDDALSGFGVRVSQGGGKTFTVMFGDDRRRVTIGRYPILSLSEARGAAKRLLAEATLKRVEKTPSLTFAEAVELFLATHCAQKNRTSTRDETERLLRRHFLPVFEDRPLASITKHDVSSILDGLLARPSGANHAFAAIRVLLRWATRRGYLTHSPCEGMAQPARLASRERMLTDMELAAVLTTAKGFAWPFGPIVVLLILTGQRRSEIGGLRWDYIDEQQQTMTLPASLTKNNRAHVFPYGSMCREVLTGIPKVDDVYLFPARGNREHTYAGWGKAKRTFDALCPIAPWTLHDLRRTVATNLAALGTPPHVTERLLNHVSGTVSGVAAIYNRHAYMSEMRQALDAWERKLISLTAS